MAQLEEQVKQALSQVTFPGLKRDIVSFGFVRRVAATDGVVEVDLAVPTQNPGAGERVQAEVESALRDLEGVTDVRVSLEITSPPGSAPRPAASAQPQLIPKVSRVIAVASGKGGVGKSTVASNLAVRLAQDGHRTGLLDADIYGPSVPLLFGIDAKPRIVDSKLVPFEKFGVRIMSLGFVVDIDTPVIWRGPMVMKALDQLLADVEWGELDYLVLDLPPGTGDVQLSLAQKVPLAGAVIVSTPQDLALIDARKGLAMFRKVNVPVLGVIENMSGFACPHCGEVTNVFKEGGAARTADLLGCRFLGRIPLDPAIMAGADLGTPIVASEPKGVHAEAFGEVARAVVEEAAASSGDRPSLSII